MYLIYDTETTGLLTTFDQVTEFAAVACDESFQIIDKHHFIVRLMRDSIPAPEALAVTPNLPQLHHGMLESEAMARIHKIMSSMAWNGGYNTMRFDDELLRFSFYRNGFNPYQHQNPKISTRFDLLPIVALFYLIHPTKLSWPKNDGKISLKLELLNQANHWQSGAAHEAMFDVEVTLSLMRTLASIDLPLLNFALAYSQRSTDQARSKKFLFTQDEHPWAYLLDPRFGASNQYIQPCYYQGTHPLYANQTLWQSMSEPDRIIRKKSGEAPWIMPHNILPFLDQGKPDNPAVYTPYLPEAFATYDHPNAEADLYLNAAWYQHNPTSRMNSDIYAWRYQRKTDNPDFEKEYTSYLLNGNPMQGCDHLGRTRRHFQSITPETLASQSNEIRTLYANIRDNILVS